MKHYEFSLDELSYHQVRCLCLLGLIVLHVVSFCNENYRVPLEHYDFWSLLSLTALYNGMFVFAAGVSLRIMLSPWVKGHRVQKHRLSYIFDFLFYLLLIDMCKVVILFGRNALLEWDFLKTIALSYIVIYFFSRISILCLIPLATGCAYYFQDIEKFLRSFEVTTSEPTWQFWGMNTYHFIVLGIFAVFYIFLAGQVFAKIEKRFIKNFLFFLQFNKHVRIHENIRRLIYQYSSASFWAYLVATTWPVMLSRIKIESLDFIYFLIFGLLSTFFISHVVVKVVNFVNRKKIVFRLSSS